MLAYETYGFWRLLAARVAVFPTSAALRVGIAVDLLVAWLA